MMKTSSPLAVLNMVRLLPRDAGLPLRRSGGPATSRCSRRVRVRSSAFCPTMEARTDDCRRSAAGHAKVFPTGWGRTLQLLGTAGQFHLARSPEDRDALP